MPNAIAKRLLRELDETTERALKERVRLVREIEREIKLYSQENHRDTEDTETSL